MFWAVFLVFVWGPAFNTIHNLAFTPFTHTDVTAAGEVTSFWVVYPLMIGFSIFHVANIVRFTRTRNEER